MLRRTFYKIRTLCQCFEYVHFQESDNYFDVVNKSASKVMEILVSPVSYIRGIVLNHRHFKDFLKDIDADYWDFVYYYSVRWLSSEMVLERFAIYELRYK